MAPEVSGEAARRGGVDDHDPSRLAALRTTPAAPCCWHSFLGRVIRALIVRQMGFSGQPEQRLESPA